MTAPAATVAQMIGMPPQVRSVSGSVWAGRILLEGGLVLTWQGDWRSVLRGRVGADFRLTGAQTLLEGYGYISPLRAGLRDISGRGGSDLLALMPGTVACDGQAVVAIDHAVWSRSAVQSEGRIQISESICGRSFTTPPLDLVLTHDDTDGVATLTTSDAARTLMGIARLSPDGWLKLRIEPTAVRLVPSLPTSAPTELEFQVN